MTPVAPSTPEELFAAVRARDAARPLVTCYDRSTGERAELSAASLGNWVAKTHYLLTGELGLGVGDTAFVAMPLHWLDLAVWFGVFSAGLALTDEPHTAAVAFAAAETLEPARAAAEVYAVALLPWGRGFDAAPRGTSDYVAAVRVQGDSWASLRRLAGPAEPATGQWSRAELMDAAAERAAHLGLADGARVLITDWPARTPGQVLVDVLAVLSVDGSLVLVRHADAGPPDAALIDQERITATV